LFHGQIISQVTEHTNLANSATPIITKKFCYDHEERLKTVTYKVADGPNDKQAKEVIGATYLYNDLGQIVLKGMHQTATMKDPAIYVGFNYHLQGMLTEVKSSLFAQQIYYDVRKDGTKGYFNGNSSELFHRFDEKQDGDLRGQKFKYDYVNRYVENKNVSTSGAGYKTWNNLEKINYDPNGNINGLIRQKDGIGIIDNLIYNYRNSGNILEKVVDNGNSNLGFVPRGTNTYSFDANGNLLTDANKGINTAITYNYLDLPTQIIVPDASGTNKTLNYTYDASGRKLAMLVSNTTDRVLYTGEIEYNNQSLPTRIHTPMGYVSRDINGLWQYSYNLKDFQGNVRVTAKYDPNTALSITTQKTDYFVMGLPIRYDSDNFNRYLYQDKEQQPYSEFFDFGWRQYDPLVGRWFNNDPADEFENVSPYTYVLGNPLRYSDPSGASVFTQFWNFMKYGPKPGKKLVGPYFGQYKLVKGAFSGAQLASAALMFNRDREMRGLLGVPTLGLNNQSTPNVLNEPNIPNKEPLTPLIRLLGRAAGTVFLVFTPINSGAGGGAGTPPRSFIMSNLSGDEHTEYYQLKRRIEDGEILLLHEQNRYKELDEKVHILGVNPLSTVVAKTVTNSKGVPYPKVIVEGFGEVPFPKGPFTPNNSQVLRSQFTPKLKGEFKNWWIEQGRPWPNVPEGSTVNIHHIKPLSHGGTNSFDNLVPLIQPQEHQPFTNWWRGF